MSGEETTRRRVLLGTGVLIGLPGCASLSGRLEESEDPTTARNTTTGSSTATRTETATESETSSTTEADEEGDEDSPGYKESHWHGRLFLEIDGDLVDFDRPKYYLHNFEDENPDAVYFHFHEGSAHGPNEWSNEKQVITFERGLNLLPGISYERNGGNHVLSYDGTTYDASQSGTSISIHDGTEAIDPTSHEIQHNDNYWIRIRTRDDSDSDDDDSGPGDDDSNPGNGDSNPGNGDSDSDDDDPDFGDDDDERSGKLIVDVNNRRLDFSAERYREAGSDEFEFRDDGNAYRWYSEDDPVTLDAALDALPDFEYRQANGQDVVTYETDDDHAGTYRGGTDVTRIITRQRTTDVDPTNYELADGDIVWVYVHTSEAPDNEH